MSEIRQVVKLSENLPYFGHSYCILKHFRDIPISDIYLPYFRQNLPYFRHCHKPSQDKRKQFQMQPCVKPLTAGLPFHVNLWCMHPKASTHPHLRHFRMLSSFPPLLVFYTCKIGFTFSPKVLAGVYNLLGLEYGLFWVYQHISA